ACRSSVDRLMSGDLPRGQGVRGPGRCTMPHGTLHPHMVLVGRAALPIYTVPPKEYPKVYLSVRGSRASRSPSPTKLMASTVMKMNKPGKKVYQKLLSTMYSLPYRSSCPHLAVPGTPRPR